MKTIETLAPIFAPAEAARDSLFAQTNIRPEVAIVLGSGLQILEDLEEQIHIPFSDIANFPAASVKGHKGEVSLGYYQGRPVAVFRGRLHRYEGHPWRNVVFPITLMHALGVKHLVLTNSAGGLHPYLTPGDLVLIRDHIYFQTPEVEEQRALYLQGGVRQRVQYCPHLMQLAESAAFKAGVPLRHGTYAGLLGPTYETPGELELLRNMGAAVVGMSTVPEAMWAMSLGMKVLGISCVTNVTHVIDALAATSHQEVVDVAQQSSQKMEMILKDLLDHL